MNIQAIHSIRGFESSAANALPNDINTAVTNQEKVLYQFITNWIQSHSGASDSDKAGAMWNESGQEWQALENAMRKCPDCTDAYAQAGHALFQQYAQSISDAIYSHGAIPQPGGGPGPGPGPDPGTNDWQSYINKFVEYYPPGSTIDNAQYARIKQDDKGGDSTSESLGYAMRMAMQQNPPDKKNFDLFWNFVQKNLDGNGLMNWHVNDGGTVEANAATDADQDIAYALCQAYEQFGKGDPNSSYYKNAMAMIQAIRTTEIATPGEQSYPLRPGDVPGGSDTNFFNSSYVDPLAWAEFAKYDTSHADTWNQLTTAAIQKVYDLSTRSPNTSGLSPNWSGLRAYSPTDPSDPNYPLNYGYDACRTPMRLAEYYKYLNGIQTPTADQKQQMSQIKEILNKQFKVFYNNRSQDGGVCSGYSQTGTPLVNYSDSSFNAPVWVAIQIMDKCGGLDSSISGVDDADMRTFGNHLGDLVKQKVSGDNYFNASLGVLCEGILSGPQTKRGVHALRRSLEAV